MQPPNLPEDTTLPTSVHSLPTTVYRHSRYYKIVCITYGSKRKQLIWNCRSRMNRGSLDGIHLHRRRPWKQLRVSALSVPDN